MGLEIEVVSRENLGFVIERDYLACSACTIDEALSAVADNYSYEQEVLISIMCDGVVIPKKYWKNTTLEHTKKLKVILEPGDFFTVAAVISLVLAVASAVYSLYMMNKIKTNSNTQAKGNSIYDVNAQGNKVNLQQVIPENFGYMKKFPDYIADIHAYYKNNKRVQEILLCQGVGSYMYDKQHKDMYIGNTPLRSLSSIECSIFEPGAKLDDKKRWCWFNSTEVTQSGHTIGSAQLGTGSRKVYLQYKSFTVGKRMDNMGWNVGDYVRLSGTAEKVTLTPNSTAYPECVWYYDGYPLEDRNEPWVNGAIVNRNNGYLAKLGISGSWFTARHLLSAKEINPELTGHSRILVYSLYLDPYEFSIGNNFFLRTVNNKNVTPVLSIALTKVYTYKDLSGNWTQKWGQVQNFIGLEGTNARTYFSTYDLVWFDLPPNTNDIADPTYPVDVLPGTEAHLSYGVQVECQAHNSFWNMAVNHGIHDDDGLYKITSVDSYECKTADGATYYGYIYGVARVDDNYNEYEDWQGFWCAGYFTDQFRIELDNKSIPNHSVVIGPFRASPIGAQCRYVELDFNAPSGLCRVEDNGDYAPLMVKLEVMYQRVGDEVWKSFEEPVILQGRNQDELGLTVKYDMRKVADWQFMVKRITPMHKDDAKYIETVKWNGLKSRLEESPTKYDGMTTIFMRITGSEVLSEMNNNQISTLWTRKLPNLTDGTLEATSEIAPALKYIMSTSKYPNIFDLDNLKEFADYWDIRGLQFNGTFDEDNTLLDAVRSVMQVGFAEPVVNGNKLQASMQRKMSRDDFTTILSAETITDFQFLKTPRRADEPLEVCVKYTSPETYKSENVYISYRSDNFYTRKYPSSNNIENLDAFGVTSYGQAVALGQRRLRQLIYMRESYTVKTEMLGLTLNFNDFIGLSLPLDTSKQDDVVGRIIGYRTDGDYLLLELDRVINDSNSTETSKRCFYINTEGKAVHLTKQGTTRNPWPRQLGFYKTTLEELGIVWDERYGNELDYPLLCSEHSDGSFIRPCWVRSIESDGSTCTIKLVQYHEEVYKADPQFTLGYGLSSYGDSPYGKSY
jgi:hypothetical protein